MEAAAAPSLPDHLRPSEGVPFAKGHGTQNDFVLFPDPDGRLDLSRSMVATVCDRQAGLGADGVIRVVRSSCLPEGMAHAAEAEWFMDYRNADGSIAEMCGNGVRVFVHYLVRRGLVTLRNGDVVPVGTRAGVKRVRRVGDRYAVDMGAWRITGGAEAAAACADVVVGVRREPVPLPGLSVDTGNPHVVVALPNVQRLAGADLSVAPRVDPAPHCDTNVELVVPVVDRERAHLRMRVYERGVGETRSCGTGAVAAVLAARVWAGDGAPDAWDVDVPGGRLQVSVQPGAVFAGTTVELTGPAVLVAEGMLDPAWSPA